MATVFDEKWGKWVALTTTILAVCTAICSLKAGSYSTKTQLQTTIENNKWSYFQSKSIKQHSCELQLDNFMLYRINTVGKAAQDFIDAKIKYYENEIARYDKEKADIQKEAQDITLLQAEYKRHGGNFSNAVMFLQIAIMLSSVAALMKRRRLWVLGLCLGVIGLAYMFNGFYLLF